MPLAVGYSDARRVTRSERVPRSTMARLLAGVVEDGRVVLALTGFAAASGVLLGNAPLVWAACAVSAGYALSGST